MKPLYYLTDKNKSTYFSLLIYDITKKIQERANEWFEGVFKEKIVPEDIYTGNLLADLDYLFSEGIWLVELAEKNQLDIESAKRALTDDYKKYTKSKVGYRYLVHKHEYSARENRVLSKKELTKRDKQINKIAKGILAEILAEEKEKNK